MGGQRPGMPLNILQYTFPQTKNYLAPNASVPSLRNHGVLDKTQEDSKVRVSENFRKKGHAIVESEDRVTDINQFCQYLKDNLQPGMRWQVLPTRSYTFY